MGQQPPFSGHPLADNLADARDPQPNADQKKSLFAPWRLQYIARKAPASAATQSHDPSGCFLCDYARTPREQFATRLILWRSERALLCMNCFPYTNGHLLIAPLRHVARLEELHNLELLELISLARSACSYLRAAVNAEGFNVGLNLGRCAGAGVPGHLHMHVVPRWPGDTNFMAVVGDARIIPQALADTYAALAEQIRVNPPAEPGDTPI